MGLAALLSAANASPPRRVFLTFAFATLGGLVFHAAGLPAGWIAGSILLGGLVGGAVGQVLTERDREQHANSTYNAIETQQAGGSTTWNNPDSNNSGQTEIDRVYQADSGQTCKDFTQTINVGGEIQTQRGTACRRADGTWKIMES